MATITATITKEEALENLQVFARERDERINKLFDDILEHTATLEDSNLNSVKKYECIMETEYLFTRIRIMVNDELKRIDYALTMGDDVSSILSIKSFFTKRKQYLLSVVSRLNETREDMNVIQRSFYNIKF